MRRKELQSKPPLFGPANRRFEHKPKVIARQREMQPCLIAGSEWGSGSECHSTLADIDGVAVNSFHGRPKNRHRNLDRAAEVTAPFSYDQAIGSPQAQVD